MNQFKALSNYLARLSLQQKILLGGTSIFTIVIMSFLFMYMNKPSYSALYTNLAQEDASKVLEYLSSQKIQYEIEDGGSTIKVPKDKVYELRLSLAGKGIPSSGVVGYEIFDKTTMGMSEFMQKLNYKRALEGELSRTISQQEGVEGVRVHIVFPQKSVFKDEEKLPTASVVLKLRNNYTMTNGNVAAIINLVSSSVEGLLPEKVTLLDTKGRLLSKEYSEDPFAVNSGKQYEIKQSVENYLATKAQSLMDNVLGYGNAMIQINADLNFDQVEKTMELYDPESQVAVSEQSIKTENQGSEGKDSSSQVSQNNTTNYEISKTVQRVVENSGNIKKLSIAAVINYSQKEVKKGEETEVQYEPRPEQQLKMLEEIIKNAVGFDLTRNDQFSIVNLSFETKPQEETPVEGSPSIINKVEDWSNLILVVAGLAGAFFVIRMLTKNIKKEREALKNLENVYWEPSPARFNSPNVFEPPPSKKGKQTPKISRPKRDALPVGDIEDELSEEALKKINQQEKIVQYVSKNPTEAAKIINSWIHQDELA
ncbi:MAG TPA: flagellar basal-body MS-ring/collar protein FliF [Ignavibacteriaceae bacterium]|nr:flagellar basal-body MS-ring/collar protein FliF [Ignavibacteriaceae bacterium]